MALPRLPALLLHSKVRPGQAAFFQFRRGQHMQVAASARYSGRGKIKVEPPVPRDPSINPDLDELVLDENYYKEMGMDEADVREALDFSSTDIDPMGEDLTLENMVALQEGTPKEFQNYLFNNATWGPEAILLAGFRAEEIAMVRSLLDAAGGHAVRVLPCNEALLHSRLEDALMADEPEWDKPRPEGLTSGGDWGSQRTVMFAGMKYAAQATVIELLEESGLPALCVCGAFEADRNRILGELLADAIKAQRGKRKIPNKDVWETSSHAADAAPVSTEELQNLFTNSVKEHREELEQAVEHGSIEDVLKHTGLCSEEEWLSSAEASAGSGSNLPESRELHNEPFRWKPRFPGDFADAAVGAKVDDSNTDDDGLQQEAEADQEDSGGPHAATRPAAASSAVDELDLIDAVAAGVDLEELTMGKELMPTVEKATATAREAARARRPEAVATGRTDAAETEVRDPSQALASSATGIMVDVGELRAKAAQMMERVDQQVESLVEMIDAWREENAHVPAIPDCPALQLLSQAMMVGTPWLPTLDAVETSLENGADPAQLLAVISRAANSLKALTQAQADALAAGNNPFAAAAAAPPGSLDGASRGLGMSAFSARAQEQLLERPANVPAQFHDLRVGQEHLWRQQANNDGAQAAREAAKQRRSAQSVWGRLRAGEQPMASPETPPAAAVAASAAPYTVVQARPSADQATVTVDQRHSSGVGEHDVEPVPVAERLIRRRPQSRPGTSIQQAAAEAVSHLDASTTGEPQEAVTCKGSPDPEVRAQTMTLRQLKDFADRLGYDLEALLEDARSKGVEIVDE